jgi:molybdopterin converting factor small subunit
MISVTLKIHHGFKKLLPGKTGEPYSVSLKDEITVDELLRDEIKLPGNVPKLILVNGLHAKEGQQLQDGDRVSLFAPMAGG